MIPGAPENKAIWLHTSAAQTRTIHHYTPIDRLGLPSGVRCWCGAVLEFRYHEPGMKSKRQAFFEQHDECVPREA